MRRHCYRFLIKSIFIKMKKYMVTDVQLVTKSSRYSASLNCAPSRGVLRECGYFVRMFDANRLSISRFLSAHAVSS